MKARQKIAPCWHCGRPVKPNTGGHYAKYGLGWRAEHALVSGEGDVTCADAAREAEEARAQRAAVNPLYPVNSKLIGVPMILRKERKGIAFETVTPNWRNLQKHIEKQRKAGGVVRCEYRELPEPWDYRGDQITQVADVIFSKT